jgi:ADP-ribosyl-[dinitrogen reductase] hydrolase
MRMAPVAIGSLGDALLLDTWAIEQAHITHHHALSDAACVHVGHLLHLACMGRSRQVLRRYVQEAVAAVPNFAYLNYRGLSSAYVVDTMQTVFYHFFRSRNFEDCVVQTVNRGGDADTAGAIVGAIAGAFYGLEQIPQRWVAALDRDMVNEIACLSRRLVELSPLGRQISGLHQTG